MRKYFERLLRRDDTTKYFIAIVVFATLSTVTLCYSLAPWIKQYHWRAVQRYRLCAYRSAMEGTTAESEAFYRAALMEAKSLGNLQLVAEIEAERLQMRKNETQREAKLKFSREVASKRPWLWPSRIQLHHQVHRNQSYRDIWSPFLQSVMKREEAVAGKDPMRFIELGDLQIEMSNLDHAGSLYRNAELEADRENQPTAKIVALDRLAQVNYLRGQDERALSLLAEANQLANIEQDRRLLTIVLIHKAQVYLESNRPALGVQTCQALRALDAQQPALAALAPLDRYADLIYALCLSYTGKNDEALGLIGKQVKVIGTGSEEAQIDSEQVVRSYIEALVNAGRVAEAQPYFYRLADLEKPGKKSDSLAYERAFMGEAKRYRQLGKHRIDLALCDLALRSREARIGTRARGLINVLDAQLKGYVASGEHSKATVVQSRIQSLINEFGLPPTR